MTESKRGGYGEPNAVGKGDLTYNDYLKVPELLRLQAPKSEPAHHDEMLFIIIHQAYELWFKLLLHEHAQTLERMHTGEVLKAHHFARRMVEVMKLLVSQIHILETMAPVDFLQFRDQLNPASGFQSVQFREFEFVMGLKDERYLRFFEDRPDLKAKLEAKLKAPDMPEGYIDLLGRLGIALPPNPLAAESRELLLQAILPIYQDPASNFPLYLLSEALIDLDVTLALWREHHVRVVERIIGFKRGTGGSSGVEYLRSTVSKKCFPFLWEVRTVLKK